MEKTIIFEKVKDVKSPSYSSGNAGIDFFIPEEITAEAFIKIDDFNFKKVNYERIKRPISFNAGDSVKIAAGIKFDIPKGKAIDILNKSGVAMKGATVGSELIDSSYTGEFNFHLVFHMPFTIEPGQKIVQGVIIDDYLDLGWKLKEGNVDKITDRGNQGFGSNYQDK